MCRNCSHDRCGYEQAYDRLMWAKFFAFIAITALMLGGLLYWDGWWAR